MKALTPNDFLLGRQAGFDALIEDGPVNDEVLHEREKVRKGQLEQCWNIFSQNYLMCLPSCVEKFRKGNSEMKVGSLILVKKDAPTPRMQWPLGVVTKLHIGSDGKCRAVELRTSKGMRTRDVRRLHILEFIYV
jgi:hypothetical protein